MPAPETGGALARHRVVPAEGATCTVAGLLSGFAEHGLRAWVCGGAPRDAVQGHAFNDVDLVVQADLDAIRASLSNRFGERCIRATHERFGLLKIGCDDASGIDVTMLRSPDDIGDATALADVAYRPGHRLFDDARNRDLTVNCLYWSLQDGFVDPLGRALDDIRLRRIAIAADPRKCAIDPRLSFRIALFEARGYAQTSESWAYLQAKLALDIQRIASTPPGLRAYVADLVRHDGHIAMRVLEIAEAVIEDAESLSALRMACRSVHG